MPPEPPETNREKRTVRKDQADRPHRIRNVRYRSWDRPQTDCNKNLKQNLIESEGEQEHDEHAKNTEPADCPPGTRRLSAPHGQRQEQLDPAGQLLQHITGSPKR
jgi:hypothetical protein